MLITVSNLEQLADKVINYISTIASSTLKKQSVFNIVLAGGDTPKSIYPFFSQIDTDWNAWHFWFSDERCLKLTDKNLNSIMAEDFLFSYLPIQNPNVHRIKGELGVHKATNLYRTKLKDIPIFDITLLGIGEDGHTASLFPDNDIGNNPKAPDVLEVKNSPKYPAERVTLSSQRLNRSRIVIFLAKGLNKKKIIESYNNNEKMPANTIKGKEQTLIFYCPSN